MTRNRKNSTVRPFRCGGLDKSCPEFICPNHTEGQGQGARKPVAIDRNLGDTGTADALDLVSGQSDSPKSTDSDDDHIVEATIRYSKPAITAPDSPSSNFSH